MDLLAAHKQRQRDQSTWTIKKYKLDSTLSQHCRRVDNANAHQQCRCCCDMDHALKTIDILRSKMVSISSAHLEKG